MKATTIGIDLAKSVFQVHGVSENGKIVFRKQLKRDQVVIFFANLAPALVGMEACGSAHYWARKLQGMGHTVRLMAPQFVKPYVKTNKHDAADAEAICEAVTTSQHALCADQECRAAGDVGLASSSPGICVRSHGAGPIRSVACLASMDSSYLKESPALRKRSPTSLRMAQTSCRGHSGSSYNA